MLVAGEATGVPSSQLPAPNPKPLVEELYVMLAKGSYRDSGSTSPETRFSKPKSAPPTPSPQSPAPIRSHRDLVVWQEAMELAELCYNRTSGFPSHERYGLMSQIRRAVVSVASNIAEGHGRRTLPACLNHLSIALGSQAELETQIELSQRLAYLNDSEAREVLDLAGRAGRRLHALMRSLEGGKGSSFRFPNTQCPEPSTHKEVEA